VAAAKAAAAVAPTGSRNWPLLLLAADCSC